MGGSQKDIWFKSEGDNWFERNKDYLGKKQDIILLLINFYNLKPETVVEIGCSNGYRLAALHERYGSKVIGVEPSEKAIEDGKERWHFIKFVKGMCETFELDESADLVIVNFVFHWISRDKLTICVAKIDEVLKEGGILILGDFGTENFIKRRYHHLPNENLFTYKQQYQNMFTSTGLYKEIAKIRFNHDTGEITADIDDSNIGTISLLRKSELYIEDVQKH
jgi:SAM-dependent methyltransferase